MYKDDIESQIREEMAHKVVTSNVQTLAPLTHKHYTVVVIKAQEVAWLLRIVFGSGLWRSMLVVVALVELWHGVAGKIWRTWSFGAGRLLEDNDPGTRWYQRLAMRTVCAVSTMRDGSELPSRGLHEQLRLEFVRLVSQTF